MDSRKGIQRRRGTKTVGWRMDVELIERLEAWIATQEFPVSNIIVIEKALREFLDRREKDANVLPMPKLVSE